MWGFLGHHIHHGAQSTGSCAIHVRNYQVGPVLGTTEILGWKVKPSVKSSDDLNNSFSAQNIHLLILSIDRRFIYSFIHLCVQPTFKGHQPLLGLCRGRRYNDGLDRNFSFKEISPMPGFRAGFSNLSTLFTVWAEHSFFVRAIVCIIRYLAVCLPSTH